MFTDLSALVAPVLLELPRLDGDHTVRDALRRTGGRLPGVQLRRSPQTSSATATAADAGQEPDRLLEGSLLLRTIFMF